MLQIIILLLVIFFWPQICSFLNRQIKPFIEKLFGQTGKKMMEQLIIWLDRGLRATRRGLKTAWDFFKKRVLRITTVYTATGEEVDVETEAIVNDPKGGQPWKITEHRQLSIDDIPLEMQNEIIRQEKNKAGSRTATCDERSVIDAQAKKRLEEDRKLANSPEEERELQELQQTLDMAN